MRIVALTLLVAACSRTPEQTKLSVEPNAVNDSARDMATCRLVGTWRPTLSPAQEVQVAVIAADSCFGPVFDGHEAVRRFVEAATITFDAGGRWSAPMLDSVRPEDVWRWKLVEDKGDQTVAWISVSPYGSERNVTFAFVSPHEFEVSDLYGLCNHYTRVPSTK